MKKKQKVFLSYSRADRKLADELDRALRKRKLPVWRDIRVPAGKDWSEAILEGIKAARGVVVLITPKSARSSWVTHEHAYARGAGIPVVVVCVRRAKLPGPISGYQVVPFTNAETVAEQVVKGLRTQSRRKSTGRMSSPTLLVRFVESGGEVAYTDGDSICMEMWLEHVPKETRRVYFEMLDFDADEPKWTLNRKKQVREFLTDDLNSYGDVEVLARGVGRGPGEWSLTSTLHQSLTVYYRRRRKTAEIRKALKQIKHS